MVLLVEPVGRGLSGYRRRHRTVGLAVAVIDAQQPIGLRISHLYAALARVAKPGGFFSFV